MLRTTQDFYNYVLMTLNFFLVISQVLIYLTNYPNNFLNLDSIELFHLQNPKRYTPELTLGFGGFFLIMSILFAVLRIEGNKNFDKERHQIVFIYLIVGGLMCYLNYFPIGTLILLGLISIFGFLTKPV